MRKDYLAVEAKAAAQVELSFVANHWTKVWRQSGGPKAAVARVRHQEEFHTMRRYMPRLPKGARLLDCGCGLGEWTVHFTREGYPTLGLELSAQTVAQKRTVFFDQRVEVGDNLEAGLPDESFDGYFPRGTFGHFEDGLDQCLREAWRMLKRSGYRFITTPFENLRHGLDTAFDLRPIGKRQGLMRVLWQNFGIRYDWKRTNTIGKCLAPFVWSWLGAHMLMGISR